MTYRNFAQASVQAYLAGKTVKAALMASGFVESKDGQSLWTDVSSSEVVHASYPVGGFTTTVTIGVSTNQVTLSIPDLSINNVTIAVAGVLLYIVETGVLIGYDAFPQAVEADGGTFKYSAPAGGFVAINV